MNDSIWRLAFGVQVFVGIIMAVICLPDALAP